MEVITGLVELFSTGAAGGIVGGLFSWLNRKEGRKVLEMELADKRHQRDHALREIAAESQAQITLAETEGDIALGVEDVKTLRTSMASLAQKSGIWIVDLVRGLMRPLITSYLLLVSSYVAYQVAALVGGLEALSAAELMKLYRDIILQLFALTALCVSWWFGSRPIRVES